MFKAMFKIHLLVIFILSQLLGASLLLAKSLNTPAPKVLLISDIDDTIKVSHVLSYKSWDPAIILRIMNSTTPFKGMASLYQTLKNQNYAQFNMVYLSNALSKKFGVSFIENSHKKLIKNNGFPEGEILLKDIAFDKEHKIKSIREMIKKYKPTVVVMIGDNGEQDAAVYSQAAEELKTQGIYSVTYIHQLYWSQSAKEKGQLLKIGQTGYATPFEIAYDLYLRKLMNQASLDWMIKNMIPDISQEKSKFFLIDILTAVTFPSFKNCADFKWIWPIQNSPEIIQFKNHILDRCSRHDQD